MFEQAFKSIDGLEQDKSDEAALEGKKYAFILDKLYRWESWAAPKGKDGQIDHNKAQTGDDLRDFVNDKLFPFLKGFTQKATGPNTIEYKIGQTFGEIKNKIQSGYNLREIIDHIDELRFRSQTEKHELSHLYEAKIKNMGNIIHTNTLTENLADIQEKDRFDVVLANPQHVSLEHRQRLGESAEAAIGKLQPVRRARLPRRHVSGGGREDRRAVL